MDKLESPSQTAHATIRASPTREELGGGPADQGLPSYEQAADESVKESGDDEVAEDGDEQKQIAGGRFVRWGGWGESRSMNSRDNR
jgi:hypothetical protein